MKRVRPSHAPAIRISPLPGSPGGTVSPIAIGLPGRSLRVLVAPTAADVWADIFSTIKAGPLLAVGAADLINHLQRSTPRLPETPPIQAGSLAFWVNRGAHRRRVSVAEDDLPSGRALRGVSRRMALSISSCVPLCSGMRDKESVHTEVLVLAESTVSVPQAFD